MTNAPQTTREAAQPSVKYRPWLHRFAMLSVGCTFALVILGGTVTSKNAGLAVPDWPTTYGYNMYLVPLDIWIGKGNVFWEHSHRLLGSVIGMLTIGLCAWLWFTQRQRPWLRWAGVGALALVIIQGVMGGLRVTELSVTLGVIHGITAQVFLSFIVVLTAAVGRIWLNHRELRTQGGSERLASARWPVRLLLAAMFIQLVLGAAMRHTHSGLAIPDFPTSYGGVLPPFTQEGIHAALDSMPYDEVPPYDFTPPQVMVHFAHRVWVLMVVLSMVWAVVSIGPAVQVRRELAAPLAILGIGLVLQAALGMLVIWSGRHPEAATAHQALGAALLATATLLAVRVHLLAAPHGRASQAVTRPTPPGDSSIHLKLQGARV